MAFGYRARTSMLVAASRTPLHGRRFFLQWIFLFTSFVVPPAWANDVWRYEVKPGDSLWTISERYLSGTAHWRKLRDLNKVPDPERLVPGSKLIIPLEWLRVTPRGATVAAINGAATISRHDGARSDAIVGARLQTNDTIETAASANVVLNFDDGARLVLLAESELKLVLVRSYAGPDIFDTRVRLIKGRAENLVPKNADRRYQMESPTAITSVRGTGFRVQSDAVTRPPLTRVEVLDGGVGVRNDRGAQNLGGGFGTIVEQGKPPAPAIRLLPAPDVSALPALVDRVPVEFAMGAVDGAVGFVMQVARTESFEPLLFQSDAPARRLRGPDLPDGNYIARIRSVDRNGLEGFAAEHRFKLDARPVAPTTISPPVGANLAEERPSFAWSRNPEATRYHFQLATDATFTRLVHEDATLTVPNIAAPMDLAPGRYFWRAAGIDAEGRGPWTDPQAFRRLPPGPALDRQPGVSKAEVTLSWRAGDPGQTWQIQVASDESFAKPLHDRRATEPQTMIPRPAPGRYYLRARTIEPDGEAGPFGSAQSFDVPAPPPEPKQPVWLLFLLLALIIAL
jgi:hypothetical protein